MSKTTNLNYLVQGDQWYQPSPSARVLCHHSLHAVHSHAVFSKCASLFRYTCKLRA